MADRKVSIRGESIEATVSVKLNGVEVYNGPGSGTNLSATSEIVTVVIDNDNESDVPYSFSLTNISGQVYVGMIQTDLLSIINPALNAEETAYVTSSDLDNAPVPIKQSIASKGGPFVTTTDLKDTVEDTRTDFKIDDVLLDPSQYITPGYDNPFRGWTFDIAPGSTLSFNFILPKIGTAGI